MTREEIITQANKKFREEHIWADATPHYSLTCIINVEVDGDWKHDHLYVKHIMEKQFNCQQIGEEELGNSQDDCYHSIHHFIMH